MKRVCLPSSVALAGFLAMVGMNGAQGQQQTVPPSSPPPITDQTPVTPGQAPEGAAVAAPLTKQELKDEKKQQKANEKSANQTAKAAKANAKAQKAAAKAQKQQDKATVDAQKANAPQ